jgi:hypothetical protein
MTSRDLSFEGGPKFSLWMRHSVSKSFISDSKASLLTPPAFGCLANMVGAYVRLGFDDTFRPWLLKSESRARKRSRALALDSVQ